MNCAGLGIALPLSFSLPFLLFHFALESGVMTPDDKICYCFHVSLRKLVNFARREQPQKPSQMSECLNAGTGCGWCIPILKKIHSTVCANPAPSGDDVPPGLPNTAAEYEAARKNYLKSEEKHQF